MVSNLENAILRNRTYTNTGLSKSRCGSRKQALSVSLWQISGWMEEASRVSHAQDWNVRFKKAFPVFLWNVISIILAYPKMRKGMVHTKKKILIGSMQEAIPREFPLWLSGSKPD